MTPPDPDRAPIFVIGSGRSGTSLLRAMLNAHPRIYLVQEASFHSWVRRLSDRVPVDRRLALYFRSFSFAWLRIPESEIREHFPEPGLDTLAELYAWLMRTVARRAGESKVRWGEKNPLLSFHLDLLLEEYPDARIIDMVRDPRAAALSHTRMPWSTSSLGAIRTMFKKREPRVHAFGDRILRVKLEDLIAEPRATLERVLHFVGEAWDESVLDYEGQPDPNGIPFPWLTMAHGKRRKGRRNWREELPPAWIRLIEGGAAEVMERFGYEPATLEHEPTRLELTLALTKDMPERIRYISRRLRAFGRIAGANPAGPEEGQRLICNSNPKAWERRPDWSLPSPPIMTSS